MPERQDRLGFIGAGNMATALVKGLLQSETYGKEQMLVSDPRPEALEAMRDLFGVVSLESNREVVKACGTVLLCVKPQQMGEVLEGISGAAGAGHLVISIAAGIPLKMIRRYLGEDVPLVRVMPNTPALVQAGASALAPGPGTARHHLETAEKIFAAVGETVVVEEDKMDAVTALSGSGPGYVFRFMECMVAAGAAVGLEQETARRLVLQTFLGAAHLAKESPDSLSRLRENVTSPGGTTAAGLSVFEEMGLEKMIREAVAAACRRGEELGRRY